jgi:hypothetical protein
MSVVQLREEWKAKPETAEYFRKSVRTVERWMAEGCPHAIIQGGVVFKPKEEVEPWLIRTGKLERRGEAA